MKLTELIAKAEAEKIAHIVSRYPCERGYDCQFAVQTGTKKMCTYGAGCVGEREDWRKWIRWCKRR